MRSATRCTVLVALGSLAVACSSGGTPPPPRVDSGIANPPQSVDGGIGSEFGTVTEQETGSLVIDGLPCTAYDWDQPLSAQLLLRTTSASCPSIDHPGQMVAVEIGRRLVPGSKAVGEAGSR